MFFTWGVDTGGLGAGAGAGLGYKTKRQALLSEKDNDTCKFSGKNFVFIIIEDFQNNNSQYH